MNDYKWDKGEYTISTDRDRLPIDEIHKFLTEETNWAKGRTKEQTVTAIKNSLSFGVYKGENLVGFARVVTDYATFAYVGEVFILGEFRGQRLSKWLMETIVNYPDLQNLRRWILATLDAHSLYEKFGFGSLRYPECWMEKITPNTY
jgi:GNAT superfamily N-acetyltransferase